MRILKSAPTLVSMLLDNSEQVPQIFSDPRYAETAQLSLQKYHHWDKVRFIARQSKLKPELLWLYIKFQRGGQLRPLSLTDAHGEPLRYASPNGVLHEQMLVDQQLGGNISFDDDSAVTTSQRERFVASALMEEAILSSKLEGASTTIVKAEQMLREQRAPRDRSEKMIYNNYHAIAFVKENVNTPMSIDFLIELQRMLTHDTLDEPDQCGRLRRAYENVVIEDQYGECIYTPPDAVSLKGRLKQLCTFANQQHTTAKTFLHPMVRAIAIHYQLAYDHPFCDGNGRTARALFYWSMLRSKYWLFEFMPISKVIYKSPSQYGYAFQYVQTDSSDLTYFIVYHTRVIAQARNELVEYLRESRENQAISRHTFDDPDLNDRQRSLLYRATIDPDMVFTISGHQHRQVVSYYTARADMVELEALGYLQSQRQGKKLVYTPTEKLHQRANRKIKRKNRQ